MTYKTGNINSDVVGDTLVLGGETIDPKAIMELRSTTQAMTLPVMNTTERDLLQPPVAALYDDLVIASGVFAFWKLDELVGTVAVDSMGVQNGSYVGSPSLGQPGLISGEAGTSVDFDGLQLVTIPTGAGHPLNIIGDLTMEYVLSVDSSRANSNKFFYEKAGAGTEFQSRVWQNDRLFITTGSDTSNSSGGSIVEDASQHIVQTVKANGDFEVYVNNTLVLSGNGTRSVEEFPITLGNTDDGSFPLKGRLSKVALYKFILPASGILEHSNKVLGI